MKKRKRIIGAVILLFIMGAGTGIWMAKREATEAVVEFAEQAVAGENQQILFGKIVNIEGNEMQYTLTGTDGEEKISKDTKTICIPVGTEVVTKLGTVTTFVKLKAEDEIQLLTEKVGEEDVIIKIWIIG